MVEKVRVEIGEGANDDPGRQVRRDQGGIKAMEPGIPGNGEDVGEAVGARGKRLDLETGNHGGIGPLPLWSAGSGSSRVDHWPLFANLVEYLGPGPHKPLDVLLQSTHHGVLRFSVIHS